MSKENVSLHCHFTFFWRGPRISSLRLRRGLISNLCLPRFGTLNTLRSNHWNLHGRGIAKKRTFFTRSARCTHPLLHDIPFQSHIEIGRCFAFSYEQKRGIFSVFKNEECASCNVPASTVCMS